MEEIKFVDRVNKKTLFFAIIIALVAILLIYISIQTRWNINLTIRLVISNIGAILIVTSLLTFFWDLWAKRVFLDEILAKAGLSKEIESAGIESVTNSFYDKVNWEKLFDNVRKLDVFFVYARTWRNTHDLEIKEIAKNKDSRIRVVLPNYKDVSVIKELSQRFNCPEKELINFIKDAENYFKRMKSRHIYRAQIDIWLLSTVPYYTYYRFDNKGVITFYSHRKEDSQVQVPVIICSGRGLFSDYFYNEFKSIIENKKISTKITS